MTIPVLTKDSSLTHVVCKMKSFARFVAESPVETEVVIPIAVYLHRTADTTLNTSQILGDYQLGRLHTHRVLVPIANLIPTQLTVSQLKVMSMTNFERLASVLKTPLVLPSVDGLFFLIDGHHRVCSEVVNAKRLVWAEVIDA